MQQPSLILITDFDHTAKTYPEDLREIDNPDTVAAAINRLTGRVFSEMRQNGVHIVISSGNFFSNIKMNILAADIPCDQISCKLGTELYNSTFDGFHRDEPFSAAMTSDFPTEQILLDVGATCEGNGFHYESHSEERNGPGKASGCVAAPTREIFAELAGFAAHVGSYLQSSGYAAKINYSTIADQADKESYSNKGFDPNHVVNFDVIHSLAGKDGVVEYMASAYPGTPVIVAGDAGNDSPAFTAPSTAHGIIVGNAKSDLVTTVKGSLPAERYTISGLPAGLALIRHFADLGYVDLRNHAAEIAALPDVLVQGLTKDLQNPQFGLQVSIDVNRGFQAVQHMFSRN